MDGGTMDLAKSLRDATPQKRELRVDGLLKSLDDKNRKSLLSALRDGMPARQIVRGLADAGIFVAENSIHKWREREGIK